MALWSVAGIEAPLLASDLSTVNRTVEKAAMRWYRVLVGVVPAWPIGKAMNSTRSQYFLRDAMRGEYFSVFLSILMSRPRSLQKPISTMTRVHSFLSKEVGSGEGVSGIPLAWMRSGGVPCPASDIIWVSPKGRIQSGMRWGAVVHSQSPTAAERLQWLYLGYKTQPN